MNAMLPSMLYHSKSRNKEDATAGQGRQIGSLSTSPSKLRPQCSHHLPSLANIDIGHCLCRAAMHPEMKVRHDPQTRPKGNACETSV